VEKLSLTAAQNLALQAQGLSYSGKTPFGRGKIGAENAIRHLGYVQIDTISVVERAHHHVLWSRVPGYEPSQLGELQREKRIFEYWYHAASYLPIEDYRFCLRRMNQYASGKAHFVKDDKKVRALVLERIRKEGPLQSKDFEAPKNSKSGNWYFWKPAKRAVEQLFMSGVLMVSERRGFQKVYDLTERVLPSHIDTTTPSEVEVAKYLIRATLRSHGLALEPEMRYLRQGMQKVTSKALAELIEEGEVTPVQVAGLKDLIFYARPLDLRKVSEASVCHLLSPFDPTVIQRKRTKTLFDFDYQIECYVPGPKRKFGYFCLPILSGRKFVGRIDAKADRKASVLLVQSLHPERGFASDETAIQQTQALLKQFAAFNGCSRIEYKREVPRRWTV